MTSDDRYQEQGEGAYVPGRGAALVKLLEARDGLLTLLVLEDGRVHRSFNVAAGRDIGAEWEHISTNISPCLDAEPSEFLLTGEIVEVVDPTNSSTLYRRHDA